MRYVRKGVLSFVHGELVEEERARSSCQNLCRYMFGS